MRTVSFEMKNISNLGKRMRTVIFETQDISNLASEASVINVRQ